MKHKTQRTCWTKSQSIEHMSARVKKICHEITHVKDNKKKGSNAAIVSVMIQWTEKNISLFWFQISHILIRMTIHQIRFFMQSIKGGKWENKKGFHKKVHKRRQWHHSIIQARTSMRNGQLTSKHHLSYKMKNEKRSTNQ